LHKKITMKIIITSLIIILSFTNSVFAQIDTTQVISEEKITTWELAKYDAGLMWGGFKQVYTSPFKWDQDD